MPGGQIGTSAPVVGCLLVTVVLGLVWCVQDSYAMDINPPYPEPVQWMPCNRKICVNGPFSKGADRKTGFSCNAFDEKNNVKRIFHHNLIMSLDGKAHGGEFWKSCTCGTTVAPRFHIEGTVARSSYNDDKVKGTLSCLYATAVEDENVPEVCTKPFMSAKGPRKMCQCFDENNTSEPIPLTRLQSEMVSEYLGLGCTDYVGPHDVLRPTSTAVDGGLDLRGKEVVVLGDLHGDYERTIMTLQMAGLIGENLKWTGGDVVLVQTGDIFDRGIDDVKVFALFRRLRSEGAEIISLMGNHEFMLLSGLWDYKNLWRCRDTHPDEPERFHCIAAQSISTCTGDIYESLVNQPITLVVHVGDKGGQSSRHLFAHGGMPPKLANVAFFNTIGLVQTRDELATLMAAFINDVFRTMLGEQCIQNERKLPDFHPFVNDDLYDMRVLRGTGDENYVISRRIFSGSAYQQPAHLADSTPFDFRGFFRSTAYPSEDWDPDSPFGCGQFQQVMNSFGMSIDSDRAVLGHTVLENGRGPSLSCKGSILAVDTGISRWMAPPDTKERNLEKELMQRHNRPSISFLQTDGTIRKLVVFFFKGLQKMLREIEANKVPLTISASAFYPKDGYEPKADTEVCEYVSTKKRQQGEENWELKGCVPFDKERMVEVPPESGEEPFLLDAEEKLADRPRGPFAGMSGSVDKDDSEKTLQGMDGFVSGSGAEEHEVGDPVLAEDKDTAQANDEETVAELAASGREDE